MQEYDVDFHIHSKYSKSVSPDMEVPVIAKQAVLKGLDIVGTGDALCPPWLSHLKQCLKETSKGIYSTSGSETRFIITTEIEDIHRVHHIILFPEISAAEDLMEKLKKHSNDIEREGRPHIRLTGEEIVDHARGCGALVGPAHAFTPWTALYKEYDSLDACYGTNRKHVKFMELGLSADTYMADRVEELQGLTFMSNSDTHSPWPQRLGREFNRLLMDGPSFEEITDCIEAKNSRKFTLNVGLDPREGKYHLTACSKCFVRFRLEDAVRLKWRCPECGGGVIKKGVVDRINELAEWDTPRHPPERPKYVHIIPLAEVISLVTGVRTMTSRKIKERWDGLIQKFGTEINILIDADIEEIKKADPEAGKVIERFRADKIKYVSGGGGQYGRPTLKDEADDYWGRGQKTLFDF